MPTAELPLAIQAAITVLYCAPMAFAAEAHAGALGAADGTGEIA